jgi:hypothetical protein
VVSLYTKAGQEWSSSTVYRFLENRIVSKDRRDIEKILFRMGLTAYDVFDIAEITRAINPRDLLWIANSEAEQFENLVTKVFESVFLKKIDLTGDTVDSPEGQNIKRYGVYRGRYGIYKQRLHPLSTDTESEIAAYLLAEKFGVSLCPAFFVDNNTIFSQFCYDFLGGYIVHYRYLFNGQRSENEYRNLITIRPQYKKDIIKMILFDFITRQDDRHLSNIAVMVSPGGESFYPLYDNGRSLFYEDTQDTVQKAAQNVKKYATGFGPSGTYWDHIFDIAKENEKFDDLLNLEITRDEIAAILKKSRFSGYRFEGALDWIYNAAAAIRELGSVHKAGYFA